MIYIPSLNTIKAFLRMGWAVVKQYPIGSFTRFIHAIFTVPLLALVWSQLIGSNYLSYFIVSFFIILPVRNIYQVEPYTLKLKEGWHLALTKPIPSFWYFALFWLSKIFVPSILTILAASIVLSWMGIPTSALTIIAAFLLTIVFRIAEMYFIAAFSYYVYNIWGVGGILVFFELLLGGILFPLSLLAPPYQKILSFLPFYHVAYANIQAILTGVPAWHSYALVVMWSVAIIVIAYPIHRRGWKRFESQGG